MWKTVYDSVLGTSHRSSGTPCQDACRVLTDNGGEPVFMAACADGAGSASLADLGSQTACDLFAQLFRDGLSASLRDAATAESALRDACDIVYNELRTISESRSVAARELACTFLCSVVYDQHAVFAQIGDGAIVAQLNGVYGPIFWPQSGEYSNTTNFLTDKNSRENLMVEVVTGQVDELAIFTDGIERMALLMNNQCVHAPFFESLFASLRGVDDADRLFEPLRQFLDSPQVNDRTDDDKTLVLATRRSAGAACNAKLL